MAEVHLEKHVADLDSAFAAPRELADLSFLSRSKIVLFGAGRLGRFVLSQLPRVGLQAAAFGDNNPSAWGSTVDGLEVLSPDEVGRRFGKDAAVVVTIYTGAKVREQLRARGFRAVPFTEFFRAHGEALLPHGALDHPEKTAAEREAIQQGLRVWADDFSRQEYVAQVRYRLTLDDRLPPSLPPADTYFPEDVIARRADECFVDCGAFDGDSVRAFLLRRQHVFGRVIAIEADPRNVARLRETVAREPEPVRQRIRIIESAVGARRERVRFDSTGTAGSVIAGAGTIEVDCAPLDELLEGETPTYIKMDIEGAEPQALAGARRVIERHRPVLAVCLYHSQEHLWEIPLFLRKVAPDYQLFLRRYSDDCWEQVCYAVPTGRVLPGGTA